MNWPAPGNDPFYHANPLENNARRGVYGVNGIPDMFVDGVLNPGIPYSTAVNQRLEIPSPLEINVDGTFDWTTNEGTTTVEITATEDFSYNSLRMQYVIIENNVAYTGPNGHTPHHQVMHDMVPTASGESFEITNGETLLFNRNFVIDESWDANECEIVVFVQDNTSREVFQAMHMSLDELFPIRLRFETSGNTALGASDGEYPFYALIENQDNQADVFDVELTTSAPEAWSINFTLEGVTYEDGAELPLDAGEEVPLTVNISPNSTAGEGFATVTLTSQSEPRVVKSLTFQLITNDVDVLVIDDANDGNIEPYRAALETTDFVFGAWDVAVGGALNPEDLEQITTLIWFTGGEEETALEPDEIEMLTGYLDNGGQLMLSGRNLGVAIGTTDFYTEYLGAHFRFNNFSTYEVNGIEGDPIGDGISFTFEQDSPDVVLPRPGVDGVSPVFQYGDIPLYAALRHETETYRTVYYSISLEGVNEADALAQLIENSVLWLQGEETAIEPQKSDVARVTAYQLFQNVPNPFNPQTQIEYAVPVPATVQLNIYSVTGQFIKTLVHRPQSAGHYRVIWDGTNQFGAAVASGIYLYELSAGEHRLTRQMVLLH
ncbi:MAG: T9SS C-terminal target domain-containing protein [Gemmatimonadetes bacterium]|nr:MAG: T9SS C-terminal target domain-containing protein [Gemmatimonadota bacterium]